MNCDVKVLTAKAIIQYLNGDIKEYKRLVNMAMELNAIEPKVTRCRYKINNEWVRAKIDLSSGIITDLSGNIVRKCNIKVVSV